MVGKLIVGTEHSTVVQKQDSRASSAERNLHVKLMNVSVKRSPNHRKTNALSLLGKVVEHDAKIDRQSDPSIGIVR